MFLYFVHSTFKHTQNFQKNRDAEVVSRVFLHMRDIGNVPHASMTKTLINITQHRNQPSGGALTKRCSKNMQ